MPRNEYEDAYCPKQKKNTIHKVFENKSGNLKSQCTECKASEETTPDGKTINISYVKEKVKVSQLGWINPTVIPTLEDWVEISVEKNLDQREMKKKIKEWGEKVRVEKVATTDLFFDYEKDGIHFKGKTLFPVGVLREGQWYCPHCKYDTSQEKELEKHFQNYHKKDLEIGKWKR